MADSYSVFFFSVGVNAQDTIFSSLRPEGIITKVYEERKKDYLVSPVDNQQLSISIVKKDIKKISYSDGRVFNNPEYTPQESLFVIPTDPLTGKVIYSGVIEIKNVSQKELYKIGKQLPSSNVEYSLESFDEIDQSFVKYKAIGNYNTKFAGDLYYVRFNLFLKFKDGKVKYDITDFVFSYKVNRLKLYGAYGIGLGSVKEQEDIRTAEHFYREVMYSSDRKFWVEFCKSIDLTISSLKELFNQRKDSNW